MFWNGKKRNHTQKADRSLSPKDGNGQDCRDGSGSGQATLPPKEAMPRHIAFIMDGNGRWAKKRGLPREYGHKEGAAVFRRLTEYCGSIGINTVTVYAFSTENWKRPEREISAIMKLLRDYLNDALREMEKNRIRFCVLGDRSRFDGETRRLMQEAEERSVGYTLRLNLAINYGGRDEIVHAVNACLREGITEISEDDISRHLYTKDSPEPDLIVRTGGEQRLSNFLLWQSEYAELYFSPILWPDFSERDVDAAVADFCRRNRRYGAVDVQDGAKADS